MAGQGHLEGAGGIEVGVNLIKNTLYTDMTSKNKIYLRENESNTKEEEVNKEMGSLAYTSRLRFSGKRQW